MAEIVSSRPPVPTLLPIPSSDTSVPSLPIPLAGYFLPSHHFPSRWQDNLSRPTCFPSHYPRTPVPMTIVDMLLPLSVPIFLPFALPTQPPKSPICTSHLRVVSQFQWKLYFIFINTICDLKRFHRVIFIRVSYLISRLRFQNHLCTQCILFTTRNILYKCSYILADIFASASASDTYLVLHVPMYTAVDTTRS